MANETVIRASIAERGAQVTTIGANGGIGLAREVEGKAYKSGGNGYYYPVDADTEVRRDGGRGYAMAVRSLSLPPAYRR